jgi:hypothetical protein
MHQMQMDLKKKQNRVFRARLVACGYSQVPGVAFNENYAPVINDVSFQVMLIVKLTWGLRATLSMLKQPFYMEIYRKKCIGIFQKA